MKLANILLSMTIILMCHQITHSMCAAPEIISCLNGLTTEVEDRQLPSLLKKMNPPQVPVVLQQLTDQLAGPIIVEYPPVRPNRNSKIDFCRLCPQGEWLLTISSIGLLACRDTKSGKTVLSHCVGNLCTDVVIDAEHKNILVASSSNKHEVYHIDTKTGSKTNITKIFAHNPQRAFQFFPMNDLDHVIIVNDPSWCYDIKNKKAYHQCSRQGLYESLTSLVSWGPDKIELKKRDHIRTWSAPSTNSQSAAMLPEGIRDIKKVLHTPSGIIGITANGAIFYVTQDSISRIADIEGRFSDIDIKKNTMAVSYPKGNVALFKIYRIMDLIKEYQTQIEKSDSDSDTES